MPTDTEKKLNGTPEPFRRRVVWGRPPATVFRAGPLPGSVAPSPLPGPAPMQLTPGILTGSMIPRAAPAAPSARTEATEPSVTEVQEVQEVQPKTTPPRPLAAAGPDLTVRPLPAVEPDAARRPEPVPAPAPAQPVASAARTTTSPVPPVQAALKPASRMPLYAGIALAALAVIALGGWIWMRPPAETPVPAVVAAPVLPVPAEAVAVPDDLPSEVAVATPVAGSPAPGIPAPTASPVAAPVPRPAADRPAAPTPRVAVPVTVVTPDPMIPIAPAPAAGPAPTEAERPSTDPDSPIATRPQPIG
jgi:Meckel syndrome type 1 protein